MKNTKRLSARKALIAWKAKTSPEQFIEEHKGIIFPEIDASPTLELISESEHFLSTVMKEFDALTDAKRYFNPTRKYAFSQIISCSKELEDYVVELSSPSLEEVMECMISSERRIPREFNIDPYEFVTHKLDRPILSC